MLDERHAFAPRFIAEAVGCRRSGHRSPQSTPAHRCGREAGLNPQLACAQARRLVIQTTCPSTVPRMPSPGGSLISVASWSVMPSALVDSRIAWAKRVLRAALAARPRSWCSRWRRPRVPGVCSGYLSLDTQAQAGEVGAGMKTFHRKPGPAAGTSGDVCSRSQRTPAEPPKVCEWVTNTGPAGCRAH